MLERRALGTFQCRNLLSLPSSRYVRQVNTNGYARQYLVAGVGTERQCWISCRSPSTPQACLLLHCSVPRPPAIDHNLVPFWPCKSASVSGLWPSDKYHTRHHITGTSIKPLDIRHYTSHFAWGPSNTPRIPTAEISRNNVFLAQVPPV